jgi:hypothetical protein
MEAADLIRLIQVLHENHMAYCGMCESVYPDSHEHWCNETETETTKAGS